MNNDANMPSEERIKELEEKYPNLFARFQESGMSREMIAFSVDDFEKLDKEDLYSTLIVCFMGLATVGLLMNVEDVIRELLSKKDTPTA